MTSEPSDIRNWVAELPLSCTSSSQTPRNSDFTYCVAEHALTKLRRAGVPAMGAGTAPEGTTHGIPGASSAWQQGCHCPNCSFPHRICQETRAGTWPSFPRSAKFNWHTPQSAIIPQRLRNPSWKRSKDNVYTCLCLRCRYVNARLVRLELNWIKSRGDGRRRIKRNTNRSTVS